MEIKIRKANPEDFEKIRELNMLLFKNDSQFGDTLNMNWPLKNEDYYRNHIKSEHSCVLLAFVENKIIGYLIGAVAEPETYRRLENIAELENMFTLEGYRSLGIGSKLVEEFKKWCKSKGLKRIRAIAHVKNIDAIKFYKNQGFREHILTLESNID